MEVVHGLRGGRPDGGKRDDVSWVAARITVRDREIEVLCLKGMQDGIFEESRGQGVHAFVTKMPP
jgi:hypothetical protein